jgi:hypothetical protein
MNSTIESHRRPLPSISTVYRPIEQYWEVSRPVDLPDAEPTQALNPVDAFLVHRLLEMVPGHPVLIDAALARTGGASTLIGMHHPRVRRVWAVADPESLPSQRALAMLRDYIAARGSELAALTIIERAEFADSLANQLGAVILTDARAGGAAMLAEEVGHWLDKRPDALVLVLGLGHVGDCPAITALLSLCSPGSAKQLRLLREVNEVLIASRLAIVARRGHPYIAGALVRLEQLYTGNYRYLDLLWSTNHAALREANLDADILRNHRTFGAISEEIEGLKRALHEANERAAAAIQALREQPKPEEPPSAIVSIRRRLSPTPLGDAWRLAKRARAKLSPTPMGKAYRLTKKVALACVPRGR